MNSCFLRLSVLAKAEGSGDNFEVKRYFDEPIIVTSSYAWTITQLAQCCSVMIQKDEGE